MTALRVALLYLLLGVIWIFFSDRFLHASGLTPEALTLMQTYKGWFYVLLTAVMAFLLWYRFHVRLIQANARLREQETLKHIMLQSIGDAVIATDTEQRIQLLNPEAARLTGWSEAEAVGRTLTEVFRIIDGTTREPSVNPAEKVLRTGKVVGLANHTILLSRDGREYQIADSGSPIRDEEESIQGIILVFRDVTTEYALQASIRQSEQRLRLAMEAISEAVWEMEVTTGAIQWSDRFFTLMGIAPEAGDQDGRELLLDSLTMEGRETVALALRSLRKVPGEQMDLNLPLAGAPLKKRWIRLRGQHLEEADGTHRVFGTVADVTAQQAMEAQLRMTQFGIEKASISVFQFDEEGRITYANECAHRSLGYTPQEMARLSVTDIDPLFNLEDWKAHRAEVLRKGSARIVSLHRRKDGSTFPVEVEINYFRFEGRLTSFSFASDISQRRQAEEMREAMLEELREAKERAEASNRAKSEFLAVMSHEMRTPLNPVVGFATLLKDEVTDPEQQEQLQTIIHSAERLLDLIDNILTYAKLDRSCLEPSRNTFNLMALCRTALHDVSFDKGGLDLRMESPERGMGRVDESLELVGDDRLLHQILSNLLVNACKFTREGSVVLQVSLLEAPPAAAGQQWFHFSVVDTGPGIPTEDLPPLFEPFHQLDNSNTRRYPGVGLGLAICRKLVDLMGGEIGVESEVGKGSRFWFRLPMSLAKPTVRPSLPRARQPGRIPPPQFADAFAILVVEDNADNALIAETILRMAGARPTLAYSGEAALEHCREARFDLVLMDLGMPHMDGFETARALNNLPGFQENTPIVALSAQNASDTEAACQESGIRLHLEKPIRPVLFLQALGEFLPLKGREN